MNTQKFECYDGWLIAIVMAIGFLFTMLVCVCLYLIKMEKFGALGLWCFSVADPALFLEIKCHETLCITFFIYPHAHLGQTCYPHFVDN